MNIDEFAKNLVKFTDDSIESFKKEKMQALADDLKDLLKSNRAKASVKRVNELFRKYNRVDDDGNLIVFSDPSGLADKIKIVDGVIVIALTDNENKWIRADSIFGNNIFAELGIKYRQED